MSCALLSRRSVVFPSDSSRSLVAAYRPSRRSLTAHPQVSAMSAAEPHTAGTCSKRVDKSLLIADSFQRRGGAWR